MPLFVCDKCKAIENTACGHYWSADSKQKWWKDEALIGLKLCSECMPTEYRDGSKNPAGGSWHNRFPKEIATAARIDQMGREHFKYTAGL